MRFNLTIAGKLVIAYGLFLIPICYLGLQLILDKEAGIAFARKEVLGVHYIAEVRDVQDALARDGNMARQIDRIKANEQASGATLNTAEAAAALLLALEGTDRGAAIQAAADLIGKAADGSNLTLDPDLDSYYTATHLGRSRLGFRQCGERQSGQDRCRCGWCRARTGVRHREKHLGDAQRSCHRIDCRRRRTSIA